MGVGRGFRESQRKVCIKGRDPSKYEFEGSRIGSLLHQLPLRACPSGVSLLRAAAPVRRGAISAVLRSAGLASSRPPQTLRGPQVALRSPLAVRGPSFPPDLAVTSSSRHFYMAIASTARGCRKVFEKLLTLVLLHVSHVPLVTSVTRFLLTPSHCDGVGLPGCPVLSRHDHPDLVEARGHIHGGGRTACRFLAPNHQGGVRLRHCRSDLD